MGIIKKKFLVFGDSHAGFYFSEIQKHVHDICFFIVSVGGATTQGLVNPNSQTNALNIFKDALSKHGNETSKCIILLGEVDCGFVIWYRRKKYNDTIENQFNRSLVNYFSFLDNEVSKFYLPKDIVICGVVPPTIKDNTDKKFLTGARSEVDASQLERTQLTAKYNDQLHQQSLAKGYTYISIFDDVICPANGIVSNEFLNEDPYDHHLSSIKTLPFWKKRLINIFN